MIGFLTRYIALSACLFSLLAFQISAQEDQPHEHKHEVPEIPGMAISPGILDFGTVYVGEEPVKYLVIGNTSKVPLTIKDIYSDCGCAVPRIVFSDGREEEISSLSRREMIGVINPGQEARIEIRFVTHGYEGELHKHVKVYTDNPARSSFKVCVDANIVHAIDVKPEILDFGTVVRGAQSSKSVLLVSEKVGSFEVVGMENMKDWMTYSVEPAPDVTGLAVGACAVRLTLSIRGDFPLGKTVELPMALLRHERLKRLRIPVKMFVQPKVVFRSEGKQVGSSLDLGVFSRPEGKTLFIEIENLVPAIPYNVLELSTEGRAKDVLDVELETISEGARYRLKVHLKPGLPKGYLRGIVITLISDHPDMMQKKIRLQGYAFGANSPGASHREKQ